jgi:hypothetical protein
VTYARREPTFEETGAPKPQLRRRRRSAAPVVLSLVALIIAAAGSWLSRPELPLVATTAPAAAPDPGRTEPAPDDDLQPAADSPAPLPPLAGQPLQAEEVADALTLLLGRDAVLGLLATTDFPRRAVATLDNLGRDHAPVAAWPVLPAPGRFLAEPGGSSQVIATRNALRYAPFVGFVASVDAAAAVDLYGRMYPLLQQAYRDLGFGERSLHARVVEVIDLLLATPDPVQPPEVTLTQVKGPVPSERPWTRYEYADASLQGLAAGQKILLRVGPENRKVLKEKLRQLRVQLQRASASASAAPRS